MPEINRAISFDAGIEQIVANDGTTPAHLPDSGQYVPGEGSYEQQLDQVLFPPSVEQSIVNSFRPTIGEKQMLTPVGYRQAHAGCQGDLQEALRTYANRPELGKLEALNELLSEAESLTELLNTYRHLLHQA